MPLVIKLRSLAKKCLFALQLAMFFAFLLTPTYFLLVMAGWIIDHVWSLLAVFVRIAALILAPIVLVASDLAAITVLRLIKGNKKPFTER